MEEVLSLIVIYLFSIGGCTLKEESDHCSMVLNNKIALHIFSFHVIFLCFGPYYFVFLVF